MKFMRTFPSKTVAIRANSTRERRFAQRVVLLAGVSDAAPSAAVSYKEPIMRKSLPLAICVSAALLAGASTVAFAPPAHAPIGVRLGFGFFQNRLAPYGRWMYHPVFGEVWRPRPRLVGADFQPYTNGYWTYTDEYGWYWVSDDPFDDVVYHFGRWF